MPHYLPTLTTDHSMPFTVTAANPGEETEKVEPADSMVEAATVPIAFPFS